MMNTREAITQLIFFSQQPKHVDIAMVLGSACVSSIDPAIMLYHDGLVSKFLISGKGPTDRAEPEWRIYSRYAQDHGVPSSAILLETEARNTRENFLFSEVLLSREIGWSNITTMAIATSPIHSRRARMTACQYFPSHVDLTMLSTSDERCIQAATWWKTRQGRLMVLEELRRIGDYGLKGHLGDF
jgi:uncharacterized SAM-binding protein YcdF (DUF218 family)